MYNHFWLYALFFSLPVCTAPLQAQSSEADWLERGLIAESRGNPVEALEIWSGGMQQMDPVDTRIGFEFIRVVTKHNLSDYYEAATTYYLTALAGSFSDVNSGAIRQEMERLQPIVGAGIYRQWVTWFEEKDPALFTDMRGFWRQMDPTPGSEINERLIEHWQRISYVKETFTRNADTIYGSDARGILYIRYGEPDRRESGTLTIDRQTTGRWLARQFDTAESREVLNESSSSTGPPAVSDREDPRHSFDQLGEYLLQFHTQPEYEIWVYEPFTDASDQSLLFIFGTDPREETFRQLQSIGDLIPERAYLEDQRNQPNTPEFVRMGLTPALALQMLYYEQLSKISPYFRERLNTVRTAYLEQGGEAGRDLDLAMRNQSREHLHLRTAENPLEASTAERLMPQIPVEVHQYRLLDESMEPVLVTFLESRPVAALLQDLNRVPEPVSVSGDTVITQQLRPYELTHLLQIYNRSWEVEAHRPDSPALSLSVTSDPDAIIQSVFQTAHRGAQFQSATALLTQETDSTTRNRYSSLFPAGLRGLGAVKNRQPEPLQASPGELEMADLILGFRDDGLPDQYPFNFQVANDQMIPADESLVLHFEVYNLAPNPDTGFTRFELTYRIYPVLEDGTVVHDEEEFYLTINFEDDRTRVVEDLEIQTSGLQEGLYELQVYIRDRINDQQQQKNIRFEVTNQGNIPMDS
ncbi:MAG: GWxTD domain-containing protein [Balneolaceae bacterium]